MPSRRLLTLLRRHFTPPRGKLTPLRPHLAPFCRILAIPCERFSHFTLMPSRLRKHDQRQNLMIKVLLFHILSSLLVSSIETILLFMFY